MGSSTSLPFLSPYRHGFVRVAVCVPEVRPAEPLANAEAIGRLARDGHVQAAAVMVFPELSLSAYAIDDLLLQATLLQTVEAALAELVAQSRGLRPVLVIGAPLIQAGRLYNCAVVIHDGRVLGVVPKSYLPNYREFYERRWFASGEAQRGAHIPLLGEAIPFGTDLMFRSSGEAAFTFHVEICEDLWTPVPPSSLAAMAGAEILLNLSASNIVIGKADARYTLCAAQSMRCLAAYAYAAAGPGESTTDLAWDGQAAIFELGDCVAETPRFPAGPSLAFADVDVQRLQLERLRTGSFADGFAEHQRPWRIQSFAFQPPSGPLALMRKIERFPFVPSDPARLAEQCQEALSIQVQGLARRLSATGLDRLVLGVSGGLDSTLALLVGVKALAQLGLPAQNLLAYTMPGFATSEATRTNAWALMQALEVTASELDIRPAARQMLADLHHPFADGQPHYDVTFENVQAGLRTDYLFRLANQAGALVVGTGDLSELALGWCTFGVGDHMSHYGVNSGVSKTLVQHLIRFVAQAEDTPSALTSLLQAVLESEISPELIPALDGQAPQSTQAIVGPYALQDFTLFYLTRFGLPPSKIAYLALMAWQDREAGQWPLGLRADERVAYDVTEIKRWMRVFLNRFFAHQFKRSTLPNGPKISSGGALSPRGDWRAPSDARGTAWLAELEAGVPDSL